MPITCAPCIFAIWPATDPTLLAAAETQKISPGLRLGDLEHTDVRGDADMAEHAEHVEQLDVLGHHRDRRERVRLHDAVLLPAGEVHERAAERILVGVVRLDHDADAVRPDGLADRDARHVVAAFVDPTADRRIDAEVAHLEQRLALAELGDGGLGRLEARLGDHPDRSLREHHLSIRSRRRHGAEASGSA